MITDTLEVEVEVASGSLCLSRGLFAIRAVEDSDEMTPSNCCLKRRPCRRRVKRGRERKRESVRDRERERERK